jgi:hypothetical protein
MWDICRNILLRIHRYLLKKYLLITDVTKVAKVITKITAIAIPNAVEILLETPIKGQVPRNCANRMLLTRIALIIIIIYSIIQIFSIIFFEEL